MSIVFVPTESQAEEGRVAAVPETVRRYVKAGLEVRIERGAGSGAHITDADYEAAGATLSGPEGWGEADAVFKIQPPTVEEVGRLKQGATMVSLALPAANMKTVEALKSAGITSLALDLVPRITRAQSMDVLSSQATVAGYKAVLLGAANMAKMCPLLMTAAGTVPPAKVVIFGAGVAGLQAIATAKRLGCVVEATDVRMAVKEQVESLGAKFIDVPGAEDLEDERGYAKEATPEFLEKQRAEVAKRVAEADLVITTAQIPGRAAPRLVSEEMVQSMGAGAVIVDMAVESGGNCALSKLGEIVQAHGVTIVGVVNLPGSVPTHASELFSKNILNLTKPFFQEGGSLELDHEDEVIAGCLLTHAGELRHARTIELFNTTTEVASS